MRKHEDAPEIEALPEPSRSHAKQLVGELLAAGHTPNEAITQAVRQAAQDAAERAPSADEQSSRSVDDAQQRAESKQR